MKCNVCGQDYSSPSLGGAGICPRCDCGIKPDGTKLTHEEALDISNRYRTGQIPYFKPKTTPPIQLYEHKVKGVRDE